MISDGANGNGGGNQAPTVEDARNAAVGEAEMAALAAVAPVIAEEQKPPAKKSRKKQPRNPYISSKKQRELRKKRHERTLRKEDSANYPPGPPTKRSAKIPTDDNAFEEDFGALVADETKVPEKQDDRTEDQTEAQSTAKVRPTTPPSGDSFAQSLSVQPPIQDEMETETSSNAAPSLQFPAETINDVFERPPSGQDTIEVSEAEIDDFEGEARYMVVGENSGEGVLVGEGSEDLGNDLVSKNLHTCVGRLVANELTRRLNLTSMPRPSWWAWRGAREKP